MMSFVFLLISYLILDEWLVSYLKFFYSKYFTKKEIVYCYFNWGCLDFSYFKVMDDETRSCFVFYWFN